MSPGDWSILAGVLGLLGSLLLVYPGWRVSRSMRLIAALRSLVHGSTPLPDDSVHRGSPDSHAAAPAATARSTHHDEGTDNDPGAELIRILEERRIAWRPLEHWLLIGGVALIVLSFAVELFLVKIPQS